MTLVEESKALKFAISCLILLTLWIPFYSQDANRLTVRNAHSMVYDAKDRRVLLFGGADEKQVYGDLWRLKKNRWQLVKTKRSPKPRTFASLVYDERKRRVVLFGGNSVLFGSTTNPAKFFGDTWELKGKKWKKLKTKNSPEPRAEAAIAYDARRQRVILFGGYKLENGKVKRLSDTWELKGNKWKKLNENEVSPRNGAAIAFDPKLKKVLLFGGSTANRDYGENSGETWVLEKKRWKKLRIRQPANIFNSNMVFHLKNKRIYRYGGWDGKGRTDQTWTFRKKRWTKLELDSNPPARNHAGMVYNSKSKRIILFGGHDGEKIFGDLWIFRRGKWYKELEHPPIKRIANGH